MAVMTKTGIACMNMVNVLYGGLNGCRIRIEKADDEDPHATRLHILYKRHWWERWHVYEEDGRKAVFTLYDITENEY